jgi:hypothetical protein
MSKEFRKRLEELSERFQETIDLTYDTNDYFDFKENADPDYVEGYEQAVLDMSRKYLKPGQKAPKGRKTGTSKDGRQYYETNRRGSSKPQGSSTLETMMKITHPEGSSRSTLPDPSKYPPRKGSSAFDVMYKYVHGEKPGEDGIDHLVHKIGTEAKMDDGVYRKKEIPTGYHSGKDTDDPMQYLSGKKPAAKKKDLSRNKKSL